MTPAPSSESGGGGGVEGVLSRGSGDTLNARNADVGIFPWSKGGRDNCLRLVGAGGGGGAVILTSGAAGSPSFSDLELVGTAGSVQIPSQLSPRKLKAPEAKDEAIEVAMDITEADSWDSAKLFSNTDSASFTSSSVHSAKRGVARTTSAPAGREPERLPKLGPLCCLKSQCCRVCTSNQ